MIERVVAEVARTLPPSSGDNLTGFLIDADHFFGESRALRSVEVDRSADRSSLVEVRAEVAPSVETVQDLSDALVKAWQPIAYSHFQAFAIHWYMEATVLRFVTVISDDSFYVSGTVRVAGSHYPTLVERYERDFGASHGLLPHLEA